MLRGAEEAILVNEREYLFRKLKSSHEGRGTKPFKNPTTQYYGRVDIEKMTITEDNREDNCRGDTEGGDNKKKIRTLKWDIYTK